VPPPGRAEALSVEQAVAIVRAAKPIAILCITMLILFWSTPAFLSESNRQFLMGLQPCGTVARTAPERPLRRRAVQEYEIGRSGEGTAERSLKLSELSLHRGSGIEFPTANHTRNQGKKN
jgi:hypothetical protein